MQNLGVLPNDNFSFGTGVNNSSQVVGYSLVVGGSGGAGAFYGVRRAECKISAHCPAKLLRKP